MRADLFHAKTAKQVAREVIFHSARINATDEQGDAPLHCALRRHVGLEVIAEMVRLGARVNAVGQQFLTPLVLAVYVPDVRVMLHLLENGGLVDGKPQHPGALQAAVIVNSFERVELLLARGADANRIGFRSTTPLFAARSEAMVRRLIQAGANPHHRNFDGQTAAEKWRDHGLVEAIEGLRPLPPSRPILKAVGGPQD